MYRSILITVPSGQYELHLREGMEISFSAKIDRYVEWEEDEDELSVSDLDTGKSGIPVFVEVKKAIVSWVKTTKPYEFWFTSTNTRRYDMYKWMANRLLKSMPAYQLIEDGRTFYFVRKY